MEKRFLLLVALFIVVASAFSQTREGEKKNHVTYSIETNTHDNNSKVAEYCRKLDANFEVTLSSVDIEVKMINEDSARRKFMADLKAYCIKEKIIIQKFELLKLGKKAATEVSHDVSNAEKDTIPSKKVKRTEIQRPVKKQD